MAAWRICADVSIGPDVVFRPAVPQPTDHRHGIPLHNLQLTPGALHIHIPLHSERQGKKYLQSVHTYIVISEN